MKEEIAKIKENSIKEISNCQDEKNLNDLKVKYLGKSLLRVGESIVKYRSDKGLIFRTANY